MNLTEQISSYLERKRKKNDEEKMLNQQAIYGDQQHQFDQQYQFNNKENSNMYGGNKYQQNIQMGDPRQKMMDNEIMMEKDQTIQ